MFRAQASVIGLAVLASSAAAGPAPVRDVQDLYFGEALYYAHQGLYFEALQRLDTELAQYYELDEPKLDTLHYHIDHAEFSVGDFELYYRMHHRAGRAIRAVLEADVDDEVRNEAAYRLARIHFQKDQPADALHALERIRGRVPMDIRDDVQFLRANVYMALDRPVDAVEVLRRLQGSKELTGFTAYNLGIALLEAGRREEALQQLDEAGRVRPGADGTSSIRDKSNLVLGTILLESEQFDRARRSLDRVRLEGPLSNQALLSAGWAAVSAEDYERALGPWKLLSEREITDGAVQEALLAVPYAYGQLDVHGRAARLYAHALDAFGEELARVEASIESIRDGRFLEALVREEINNDRDWVIRLRSLPEAPETYYLMALLASHDFQASLQNYLDLEDLRSKLDSWHTSLDAFEDVIALRRAFYEPLLPDIDAQFRELDAQIRLRLEQRASLEKRLQAMLTAPRPDLLATAKERAIRERLRELAAELEQADGDAATKARIARLEGVLQWRIRTEYHERLTAAHTNLRALNEVIDAMQARYDAYVRARQRASHSYEGFEAPIRAIRSRVIDAQESVAGLMAQQGRLLETMAIRELQRRRERLEVYQVQARYALADSYDRATAAQLGDE